MVPPDDELDEESPQAASTFENATPPSAAPVALIISRREIGLSNGPPAGVSSPAGRRPTPDPSVSGVLKLVTSSMARSAESAGERSPRERLRHLLIHLSSFVPRPRHPG